MLWLLYVAPMRLQTYLNPTPHGIPATVAMSVHTKKAKKGEGLTHSFPFPPSPPPTPHPTHTPRLSYYALSRGLEVQFDTFLFSYPSSRASSIQLYCQVSTVLVNVPLAALVWHLVGAWPCLTPGHTFKRQGMIMVVCAIILLAFALYFLLIDPFLCQSVSLRKFVNRSWLSARDTERAAGGADGVDGVDGVDGGGVGGAEAVDPLNSGFTQGYYLAYHGVNDKAMRVDLAQLYSLAVPSLVAPVAAPSSSSTLSSSTFSSSSSPSSASSASTLSSSGLVPSSNMAMGGDYNSFGGLGGVGGVGANGEYSDDHYGNGASGANGGSGAHGANDPPPRITVGFVSRFFYR